MFLYNTGTSSLLNPKSNLSLNRGLGICPKSLIFDDYFHLDARTSRLELVDHVVQLSHFAKIESLKFRICEVNQSRIERSRHRLGMG